MAHELRKKQQGLEFIDNPDHVTLGIWRLVGTTPHTGMFFAAFY